MSFMWQPEVTPLVILAEGCFGTQQAKTATGVIRYGRWPVTAVIDSQHAGRRVAEVLGGVSEIPVVAGLSDAMALFPTPKALLVGTAPMGGGLPEDYRQVVLAALASGLHVMAGLHVFLNADPQIKALADQQGLRLWDVRTPPPDNVVTRQLPRPAGTRVITMVGSDCSVGKMFTALELTQALQAAGDSAEFVATGQTGMMISGHGIPLDRIIGDFMAGQMEREIDAILQAKHPDWVIVEGQGSLLHPAYSGVTLALLHGSAPDGLILCHNPRLKTIRNFDAVAIPDLDELVCRYETAAAWIKPARVLGISLNTHGAPDEEAQAWVETAQAQTGLPVTDPVRYGATPLVVACQATR